MSAVWCKKLTELVNKNTPCEWRQRGKPGGRQAARKTATRKSTGKKKATAKTGGRKAATRKKVKGKSAKK